MNQSCWWVPLILWATIAVSNTSTAFVGWAKAHDINIDYILHGFPYQNIYAERFNRTYRNDLPDCYPFSDLNEVQQITEDWIEMYHHERPHNALRAMTPAEYRNAV
ncbi:integrase core domain-containing protein [Alteromonas lipotrueiana]|uniref:integrase core domain-containing protein n=1 Tax=Alteromonas lipotrueiana TaxID=2803815 RepID=UPI001C4467E3